MFCSSSSLLHGNVEILNCQVFPFPVNSQYSLRSIDVSLFSVSSDRLLVLFLEDSILSWLSNCRLIRKSRDWSCRRVISNPTQCNCAKTHSTNADNAAHSIELLRDFTYFPCQTLWLETPFLLCTLNSFDSKSTKKSELLHNQVQEEGNITAHIKNQSNSTIFFHWMKDKESNTQMSVFFSKQNWFLLQLSSLQLPYTYGLLNWKDEVHEPYVLLVIPNRDVPEYDDCPGLL